MSNRYNQGAVSASETRFSASPFSGLEFSRMTASPKHLTTFNAGEIIPIYCKEVLPNQTTSIDLDFVIRQNTVLTPTMSNMEADIYAFFVPNRIINDSWKNVQGENTSGQWIAPQVSLVPLYDTTLTDSVKVPVGSVADYYGFPTQDKIPAIILQQMNDLKFRGYLACYNEYFRDQNYQPPIPFTKLNAYNGFFEPVGTVISLSGQRTGETNPYSVIGVADGSTPSGAVIQALYGDGAEATSGLGKVSLSRRLSSWSALDKPLRACKRHDYFTSVLPAPQKGASVTFSFSASAPIQNSQTAPLFSPYWKDANGNDMEGDLVLYSAGWDGTTRASDQGFDLDGQRAFLRLEANLANSTLISLNDLRMGSAIQQTYEVLARGGSRYREFVKSFFGIETDDPFLDIPRLLGHIRRDLDLYQTAQTSASAEDSTPQGNLAAFGYTNSGGNLFTHTALEHGYYHIFAIVRHNNVYPAFLSRDNFRLTTLDFYLPTLANIAEQPVYTREINPFCSNPDSVFGYQEAWAEYRYENSWCSSSMRSGIGSDSLAVWNYCDEFDSSLEICDGEWIKSNSAEVLDRTLAVKSTVAPQFKAMFRFNVDKQLPMPTYSVPGLDII